MRIHTFLGCFVFIALSCSNNAGAPSGGESEGEEAEGEGDDCPANPSAIDVVTPTRCTKLVLEVDNITGHEPREAALDMLMEQLDALVEGGQLGKPEGVEILRDETEIPAPSDKDDHVYTFDELDALLTKHRSTKATATEAALSMLYVGGHYEDERVLGFAYGGSRIVMFRQTVESSCQAGPPAIREVLCNLTEATVLIHEMGHLLGLVDNGIPMVTDHEDPDPKHDHHDVNDQCAMYWASEKSDIVPLLIKRLTDKDDSVSPYDQNCLDDLAAVQP